MTWCLGLRLTPEHRPQITTRDVAEHRRVTAGAASDLEPIAQLRQIETTGRDVLSGDESVFWWHVLLKPSEHELVDA